MRARKHRGPARQRGSTLVVAMWVIIALTGVVLVMSDSMRVEAVASANRLAQAKADAAARGAEAFVLSVVDAETASPGSAASVNFEARQIGDCVAWVIRPDTSSDQTYAFGLSDEAGKIDLNTATDEMLLKLPNMTADVVDAVIDWRDADQTPGQQGAESDYYGSLPTPYRSKDGPLESVEELLLVKGVTRDLLFGYDRNRNGVLDVREVQAGGMASQVNSAGAGGRGISPFVTVHGLQASSTTSFATTTAGSQLVNLNASDTSQLRTLLQNNLGGKSVDQIVVMTREMARQRPFSSVFDWHFRIGLLSADDLSKVYTQLNAGAATTTTGPSSQPSTQPAPAETVARVNVATAPREVLLCLPTLEESDAAAIISRRQTSETDPANIAWLVEALAREKVLAISRYVTGRTMVYSADIVAATGDGRAYKRYRIIVDARQTPANIVYRRDLTSAGWPLAVDVRSYLRAGQGAAGLVQSRGGPARP